MEIRIKKKFVFLLTLLFLFLGTGYFFSLAFSPHSVPAKEPLSAQFDFLRQNGNSTCSLDFLNSISQMSDEENLRGSCCGEMSFHKYQEQIEGLTKYINIPEIPPDPYDISVSLAKKLLNYQKEIKLSEQQQAIYDQAMKISEEGGPCCCRCWRWFTYEGLAKFLIIKKNFNSQQIAQVWDLSEGCGGDEHKHQTKVGPHRVLAKFSS